MRFEKMNQDTIKCVLSEQELRDNGLDVYELLNNEDKTRIFMQGVFEAAQREMGEKSKGRFASMEVTLLPNRDVELTLSKSSEADIIKSLEYMKNLADGSIDGVTIERIDAIERMQGREQMQAYKELLDDIHAQLEAEAEEEEEEEEPQVYAALEEEALETQESGKKERYNRFYTFILPNIREVMTLAAVIQEDCITDSSLYRLDNEAYYMLIDAKGVSFNTVYKFLGTSLEYVQEIVPGSSRQAHIREHADCVIAEHAIEVLKQI
ncbi:MAG: adaptor protein MecA [Lachnospiraceae bacterium]